MYMFPPFCMKSEDPFGLTQRVQGSMVVLVIFTNVLVLLMQNSDFMEFDSS
jgi:hypothetical protein